MPMLVPREQLANAISLNAIMLQVASVAGPTIGGFVIAIFGVKWVYALNALTFIGVIVALLMMRDVPRRGAGEWATSACARYATGWDSSLSPIIRATMLLDFFATFFSSATALLPIFAQDARVGARGYGWLCGAIARCSSDESCGWCARSKESSGEASC
jgi:predicted MFS family arabinose efflux permease